MCLIISVHPRESSAVHARAAEQLFPERSVENAIEPIITTPCGIANIYIES